MRKDEIRGGHSLIQQEKSLASLSLHVSVYRSAQVNVVCPLDYCCFSSISRLSCMPPSLLPPLAPLRLLLLLVVVVLH